MTNGDREGERAERLRKQAEELVSGAFAGGRVSPSAEETERLMHELSVHQLELEMQNDELRRIQADLEVSRARYFDLYDMAPVGYVTLSEGGVVIEANLTATCLLGLTREDLVGYPLARFVVADDADNFHRFLAKLTVAGAESTTCELRLESDATSDLWVRLDGRQAVSTDGTSHRIIISDISEWVSAEFALAERERLLVESQRVAKLGHYVYDIVNDHWDGSESLYQVLGTDSGCDRTFAGWLGLVHPADRARLRQHFVEEVVTLQVPFDTEFRLTPRSDRPEMWVHGLGSIELGSGGAPAAMFGVIQDISERKLAENELSRDRALLAQAETIGHIGNWRVAMKSGEAEWSEETAFILGLTPSSEPGEFMDVLSDAVVVDDRAVFDEWVAKIAREGEPSRADFRIERPGGEVRWVCAHGQTERGSDGEPCAIAGVIHDVTDRKRDDERRIDRLERAANIDRLTGLNNRRGFDLVAEQALEQAGRSGQGAGVIFGDMDGLKGINDEFGHVQGDRALKDVTAILTFTLRSADVIARIGGDEFVVLAVGETPDAIEHLDERLHEGFDFFNATNERPYVLSLSSGTAWGPPGGADSLEDLIKQADERMYLNKQASEHGGER